MKSKCKGKNKNGIPCRNYPVGDTKYCRQHFPLELINTKTKKSIKIPNSVFWFVAGALGEAIVSDVFDYVKYRFGYEFLIPPIKSSNDHSSPTTTIIQPTHSPTPTLIHQPSNDADDLLPEAASNINPSLENRIEHSLDIYPDIPDTPYPPLSPQVGTPETSNNDLDTKFGTATSISGTTILSVLPASTPYANDDYTPPYIPPSNTDFFRAEEFSDDKRERVYMDEQALTPLIGTKVSNDIRHESTSYFDTLREIFFLAFAFYVIALLIYIPFSLFASKRAADLAIKVLTTPQSDEDNKPSRDELD